MSDINEDANSAMPPQEVLNNLSKAIGHIRHAMQHCTVNNTGDKADRIEAFFTQIAGDLSALAEILHEDHYKLPSTDIAKLPTTKIYGIAEFQEDVRKACEHIQNILPHIPKDLLYKPDPEKYLVTSVTETLNETINEFTPYIDRADELFLPGPAPARPTPPNL